MSQKTTITLLVLDVDGVMSDGKVTYTSDGAELKSFNIKDGVGIKCIQKAGVQTAIITGRVSPMVARRASELGIHHLIQGREDKLAALKELIASLSIELKNVAYMGDDLPDIEAITSVGIGACPADAAAAVLSQAGWISTLKGGEGCVREFCEYILDVANV
jgi:3-deoxy-D-manno-octulosonate 8-phosphate phosphatase (KDO 8-P phosphatase)